MTVRKLPMLPLVLGVAAVILVALTLLVGLKPGESTGPSNDSALKNSATNASAMSAPHWITAFRGPGSATKGRNLYLVNPAAGQSVWVARADPYVRPVVSTNGSQVLFVTVRQVAAFPGASWTLFLFNRPRHALRALASWNAMGLSPLGWINGRAYYSVARETETGLYYFASGKSHYVTFLFTEPFDAPSLSPNGRYIAYMTPDDCSFCTVSIFNMSTSKSWFGPSGAPGPDTVAWTANGDDVVTIIDKKLTVIDAAAHAVRYFRLPAALPLVWRDVMRAVLTPHSVQLIDLATGRTYTSGD